MLTVNKNTCKEACYDYDYYILFVKKKKLFYVLIKTVFFHPNSQLKFETFLTVQGHEPFVSYEGLEQLHRFIFVMAVTHISYSCLTMLLAIVKVRDFFIVVLY